MPVTYGQSGYVGFSRSVRAHVAETEGRSPITRAARTLAELTGCTIAMSRRVLEAIGPCEWHHVGKYAAAVDFFDPYDPRAARMARLYMTPTQRRRAAAKRETAAEQATIDAWRDWQERRVRRELAEGVWRHPAIGDYEHDLSCIDRKFSALADLHAATLHRLAMPRELRSAKTQRRIDAARVTLAAVGIEVPHD